MCLIGEGEKGFCKVRSNSGGTLFSENYGRVTVSTIDSIERKPIFHYIPGARLLSVGSYGCNLDCKFCQNQFISRPDSDVPYRFISPEELVSEAVDKGAIGIAFTFNEPTIWSEYIICVSLYAKKKGLSIILNTNGYIQGQARQDLINAVDAVKVDIKGFSNEVYRDLCSGSLKPVLETCEMAFERSKHIELSYLMIPGMTDTQEQIERFGIWVMRKLDKETPVHLFRFQPGRRMLNVPVSSTEDLGVARRELLACGLKFVYMGGPGDDFGRDTICPDCGKTWIERKAAGSEPLVFMGEKVSRFCPSYSNIKVLIRNGACPGCGKRTNIIENLV